MQRIALTALVALPALSFAACGAPTGPIAPTAAPRASAALTNNFQDHIDFSFTITNPCGPAGEVIDVTGRTHIGSQFTVNDNGIELHSVQNAEGLHGIGETTGLRYEFILVEHSGFRQEADAASNDASMETFKVVSQGSTDNFVAFTNMHVTLNANGEPTAEVDVFRLECQG